MLPRTTKRTTTNLKTKNNQNCQKIELYGSPTIKELKKHLFRLVGGADTGSQAGEDSWQSIAWSTWAGKMVAGGLDQEVPHLCADNGRNNWGVRQTMQPRVLAQGNKTSKLLNEEACGGLEWWEKLPASQESSLERPTGS